MKNGPARLVDSAGLFQGGEHKIQQPEPQPELEAA